MSQYPGNGATDGMFLQRSFAPNFEVAEVFVVRDLVPLICAYLRNQSIELELRQRRMFGRKEKT